MTWMSRCGWLRPWPTTSPTCDGACPVPTRPQMRHDQRGDPQIAPAGPPLLSSIAQGRGEHRMRHLVTGEYLAQVRIPDPFAAPAWRSPVYRTLFAIVASVQAARLIGRLIRCL